LYTTSEIFCKPVFPHFFPFVGWGGAVKPLQETCLIGQLMAAASACHLSLRLAADIAGADWAVDERG
jgi:hypothetical protein